MAALNETNEVRDIEERCAVEVEGEDEGEGRWKRTSLCAQWKGKFGLREVESRQERLYAVASFLP